MKKFLEFCLVACVSWYGITTGCPAFGQDSVHTNTCYITYGAHDVLEYNHYAVEYIDENGNPAANEEWGWVVTGKWFVRKDLTASNNAIPKFEKDTKHYNEHGKKISQKDMRANMYKLRTKLNKGV